MKTTRKLKHVLIVALLAAAVGGVAAATAAVTTAPVAKIHLRGGFQHQPGSVLSAFGSIWVASHVGNNLDRIDPRTNSVKKVINVGENQCVDLIAGGGAIWDWNCSGEAGYGVVYEISPRTNRVVWKSKKLYGTFGAGSLWAQSEDWTRLERIDPKSHVVIKQVKWPISLPASGHIFPAAVCGGSVWAIADTSVIRYDTATNQFGPVIPLPAARSASSVSGGWFDSNYAACAAGKVWIPNLAGLYSVDMRTNKASRLGIAIHPNSALGDPGLTASGDQVFVRTSDRKVTQVDAPSGKVVGTYPAGGGGGEQIVVGYGSLWIPAFTASSVWRERIPTR